MVLFSHFFFCTDRVSFTFILWCINHTCVREQAIDSALEVLNYLPHDPILAAALDPAVQQDQDEAAQGQPEVAQTRGIEVTPMQRANLMLVDEALFLSASVRLEHGQPTLALAYACLMEHYTNDNKRAR